MALNDFDIGLPKGFSIGGYFHVAAPSLLLLNIPASSTYTDTMVWWGLGTQFHYTLLKEVKALPSISVGAGVSYNDTLLGLANLPLGNVTLDSSNLSIPATVGFKSHSYVTGFMLDFNISKNLGGWFEPFGGVKFTQSIFYNVTEVTLNLDLTGASPEARTLYGGSSSADSSSYTISNQTADANGNLTGVLFPVTDFILSGGFEFVMKLFRMGLEFSYGTFSQKGMVSLSMRIQAEKDFLQKKKEK
jgi:hypothetical protein